MFTYSFFEITKLLLLSGLFGCRQKSYNSIVINNTASDTGSNRLRMYEYISNKLKSIVYFYLIIVILALSVNRPMPLLANPSSSLSPDAPMWMPLTPPSTTTTTNWRLSPEIQSNGVTSTSPPLSSSPLSTLFPPLLLPPAQTRAEWSTENENIKSHWHHNYHHKKNCCNHCPHCGRSVY